MMFSPLSLAGYGFQDVFSNRTIRLANEHERDELQFEHYADDWDEEDDGWGQAR